ncbi:MAG: flagellar basal body rod protein FlgB [Clostridiales bacterium]|nr:flagellar basal body rod protein FlgB [Clostridiales bacterium]
MISSNAFNYINVLGKAADASWTRHEVLSNNLANVDTPRYKRKDVQFETYLMKELIGDNSLDKRVANINLRRLEATTYTDYANLSYRMDGNNVDIDTETANLAQNQIKYYALLDSITHEFNRLKSVLSSR